MNGCALRIAAILIERQPRSIHVSADCGLAATACFSASTLAFAVASGREGFENRSKGTGMSCETPNSLKIAQQTTTRIAITELIVFPLAIADFGFNGAH